MSETPTARELLDEWKTHTMQPATLRCVSALAARVEAVLALHWRRPLMGQPEDGAHHCAHCGVGVYWPCPTMRLLAGGKP